MKTIFLVRHGEAENNVKPQLYVGQEARLTKTGLAQAQRIATRAKRLPLDAVIASDFTRAQETALIISEAVNIPVETSALFGERRHPEGLVGLPWNDEETARRENAWIETFFKSGARFEGGENYDDMLARAKAALQFLAEHKAPHILVVTHGFFLRLLVAYVILGESVTPQLFKSFEWGIRTRNTGITVLHFNKDDTHQPWWLSVWNDHAHLADA